ncbi:MAG: hypothetical protein KDD92_07160 [Caldilineaceae bacterium]|nr:hypothetical protein [Caldilineaceae bacterium]
MLQRPTQTAAFWRDQFEVTSDDLEFLYNLLLDAQAPKSREDLAVALAGEYLRRENATIETELAKGDIYLPKESYAEGQTLVFPALDFAVGDVLSVRDGQNPEHGKFDVIAVQLAGEDAPREFAAALQTPHRLSEGGGNVLLDDGALLSAEEIYSLYNDDIDDSLLFALEEGSRREDFVEVEAQWLLADMLAEVHIGHLNIAEALIEVAGHPLSAQTMLGDLDLDENVPKTMRLISLNHALNKDKRFDTVEKDGRTLWYLKRMEPEVVGTTPALLRYTPVPYNRSLLSVEMLQLEWELDDEWGESSIVGDVPALVPSTSFTLIYPHRKYGTIPLSSRTKSFFPRQERGKSLVTLVDGRWGTRYEGWVAHQGRYVSGLGKWMDDHELPVGAYITLERAEQGNELIIDFRTRRAKREWARVATADLETMRLTFDMNKVKVACEYDDTLIVAESDPQALAQLRQAMESADDNLAPLVEQIVRELTGLNPQGTVHAKSVYSAVNMVRRTPPGPVFYALISNPRFKDVGGGLFALA